MNRAFLIILSCLIMTACWPFDSGKPKRSGKEFMSTLGQCKDCGKRKINLFGDEK